jgi:hypothetical protein
LETLRLSLESSTPAFRGSREKLRALVRFTFLRRYGSIIV